MRHFFNIHILRVARHVSAEHHGKRRGLPERGTVNEVAHAHKRNHLVRNLNPHERAAGDGRFNAQRVRGKRKRQIALKRDDARELDALRGFERILRHRRPHVHLAHFHLNAEMLERSLDDLRVGLHVARRRLARVFLKQINRGNLIKLLMRLHDELRNFFA